MGRFITAADKKTIRADWWEAHEQVVIRKFSYGDRQYLAGQYTEFRFTPDRIDDGDAATMATVANLDLSRMNLAILERGIASWTFEDEDGRPVVLSPRSIAMLTDEDADFILAAINEYNRPKGAEEQRKFRAGDPRVVEDEWQDSGAANTDSVDETHVLELARTDGNAG